jgi:hypothetical protein
MPDREMEALARVVFPDITNFFESEKDKYELEK